MVRKEVLIAGGEHVGAVAPVVVAVGRNDHLVEDSDRVDRVRRRAGTTVVVVDGVGHVRLVIRAVKVLAVPALREENLDTDAVLAGVDVREVNILALSILMWYNPSLNICRRAYLQALTFTSLSTDRR